VHHLAVELRERAERVEAERALLGRAVWTRRRLDAADAAARAVERDRVERAVVLAVDGRLCELGICGGLGRAERGEHALRQLGDVLDDAVDGADELVELGVTKRPVLGDPLRAKMESQEEFLRLEGERRRKRTDLGKLADDLADALLVVLVLGESCRRCDCERPSRRRR